VQDAGGRMTAGESEDAIELAVQDADYRQRAEAMVGAIQRVAGSPLIAGNQVELLIDGPRTYAAMLAAMAQARRSIHVETYIFSDDEVGRRFARMLVRKHRQGVAVRVIYDSVGSIGSAGEFFTKMKDAGIQVAEFQPFKKSAFRGYNNRDHRKLLIVDSRTAFTGGLNISSTYSIGSSSRPGPEKGLEAGWRDTHLEITGPAVKLLQSIFLETWKRLGQRAPTELLPPQKARGPHLVQVVASRGGDGTEFRIYDAYLTAIRSARQRIWITQAYFAPNEELRTALRNAVRRGVDVRIIVPGFSDSGLIYHASRATWGELLEGGVKMYELTDALLHSKAAVVDGFWSTVGSCNIDARSFAHNNEINLAIAGGHFAASMELAFRADLKQAKPITPAQWRERPASDRVKEFLSNLFAYWL
jgi:cardiolipin synthase